jgi:hypothetical protein
MGAYFEFFAWGPADLKFVSIYRQISSSHGGEYDVQRPPPQLPIAISRHFVVILFFNEDLPRAKFLHLSLSSTSTTRPLPLARSQPIVSHHHWPPRHSTPIKPRTFCPSAYSSLMMEAARTSETSVENHFTRQYNPEDSSEQN